MSTGPEHHHPRPRASESLRWLLLRSGRKPRPGQVHRRSTRTPLRRQNLQQRRWRSPPPPQARPALVQGCQTNHTQVSCSLGSAAVAMEVEGDGVGAGAAPAPDHNPGGNPGAERPAEPSASSDALPEGKGQRPPRPKAKAPLSEYKQWYNRNRTGKRERAAGETSRNLPMPPEVLAEKGKGGTVHPVPCAQRWRQRTTGVRGLAVARTTSPRGSTAGLATLPTRGGRGSWTL